VVDARDAGDVVVGSTTVVVVVIMGVASVVVGDVDLVVAPGVLVLTSPVGFAVPLQPASSVNAIAAMALFIESPLDVTAGVRFPLSGLDRLARNTSYLAAAAPRRSSFAVKVLVQVTASSFRDRTHDLAG
jgi:hypothetical protein